MAAEPSTAADRGPRLRLRLIAKVGGLPALADPTVRGLVERILGRSAHSGFRAEVGVGRAFTRVRGSGPAARPSTTRRRGVYDLTRPRSSRCCSRLRASSRTRSSGRPAGRLTRTARFRRMCVARCRRWAWA